MDGWMDRWKPWKHPSTDQSKFYHLEDEIYMKLIKTFPARMGHRKSLHASGGFILILIYLFRLCHTACGILVSLIRD